MQALITLHDEIINMYAFHIETCTAFHRWNDYLKGLQEQNKTPNQQIFFGKGDPNNPDAV